MEQSRFAKLVEGVALVDVDSESLTAQKAELAAKLVQLNAALENTNAALAETDTALAARAELPSVADQAFGIASALSEVGCNDAAIRAAIVAQFSKKMAAVHTPRTPSAGGAKEKKISVGLPSEVDADSILSAVRTAGPEGIRMETLYERFPAVAADTDKSRLAVFATVKNALFDKRVLTMGQARGMRYVWVDAPAAPPADAPAAQ